MAPTLKEKAQQALRTNPSALGDPISLKAETSQSTHDLDAEQKRQQQQQQQQHSDSTQQVPAPSGNSKGKGKGDDGKTLKQVAQESNPTMLGDPVSLKAETSGRVPTEGEEGAKKGSGGGRESKL